MRTIPPWLAAALLVLVLAAPANAATIGFTLDVTSSLVLQNDSDVAAITSYRLTIGDLEFNYDVAAGSFEVGSPGSAFTRIRPDGDDGGERTDVLEFTFANFLPGDRFVTVVDIDPDAEDSDCCAPSGVLFNNGDDANATLFVTFSNGYDLSYVLTNTQIEPDPDGSACAAPGSCVFSTSFEVPEPAGALLLIAALGAALLPRALLQLL